MSMMSLAIGQPIDARELEQATSQWSPERFASMCDALVWAASGRRSPDLPRFTNRVNSADKGIDAEWEVEIPPDDQALPTPLVGPGWNVFQYKKRDLIAQDRRRIISNLKSSLRGAVASLTKDKERHPDRYALFLNVDLKHDQNKALKKAILEKYDRPAEVHVEVVGAAELAALLNNHPHLRAAYFVPLSFKTWEEANRSHRAQKLFRLDVDLVGREEELNRLRSLVDDLHVRAIVITGPHDIGKSRLALEATKHRPQDVIFALDPRSMKVEEYRNLVAGHGKAICVVEDPDPDTVESLTNEILTLSGLKLIVTLPTSAQAPTPSYGRDERVQSLHLEPLNDEDSRKLLKATGKHLDYGVESWILDRAGGNPGVLLAAASVGEKLRGESVDFTEDVGREFEKRIKSQLGQDAFKCAKLLSPLTHVGISGKFAAELKVICDVFGEGWQPSQVLSTLQDLEEAGLAKRGGSFAELTIPLLANYLMEKLLCGRRHEIFALFGKLEEPGRLRFLRRLSQVRGPEVEGFWNELFSPNGLLANLKSALEHSHLLRLISGTVPERMMRLLEEGLKGMNLEERSGITGDKRRELMWALEELLLRRKTSVAALRCLAMLAEAETENYGNNATGLFCESFHPFHPQLPLPLHERLELIKDILSLKNSGGLRLIAIKAITSGLRRSAVVSLRHGSGPEPLDARPNMTYGDVWDYIEALVDLLMIAAQSEEPTLAEAARAALPHSLAESAIQARPQTAVARFETVTDWVLTHTVPIPVADLVEALRHARDVLEERKEKADEKTAGVFQECVQRMDVLISRLDKADFPSKLKRWAGKWTRYDHDYELEEGGGQVYRGEKELRGLAKEAAESPSILADDLLTWLCSGEAQKAHMFFWWLGKVDSERKWLAKIEEIGTRKNGAVAFSAYCGGLSQLDRPFISKRLDELIEARRVTAEAIASATGYLSGDSAGVKRVETLLQEKRVDPVYVEQVLRCGRWSESLSPEDYLRLLKAIAGPELEYAAAVIDFLGMWLYTKKPIEGQLAEFAWQCLEAAPTITANDAYDCNELASKLAQSDLERGFRLLEKLLTQPHERECWNPIDRYGAGENKFWNVLHKTDRKRALRLVLSLALDDQLQRLRVTWDLREIIDQQGDADVLIAFALEGERQAGLVCESITTARPGFWPIALKIIERYPSSQEIQDALASGITQMGEVITGPISLQRESCRREVERVLSDPATPPAARSWLREVLSRLEGEVAQHIVWEYDEDVNSLRRYIQDKDSPERIWAIGRVLKYAEWKDIRRLLTVEDIAEALPQVDLPPKKRRALEKAMEVWQVDE